ncbi:MAG: hypothetical protein PVJ39_08310 [Gammaproteobacteria bacterium]|jgi:hypothetical protein
MHEIHANTLLRRRVPRTLFVSYDCSAGLGSGPTMIGVLKRGLRLIDCMPPNLLVPHWLHWGQLEIDDPLIQRMAREIPPLTVPWQPGPRRNGVIPYILGIICERATRRAGQIKYLRRLFDRLQPDLIVLGEAPLAGLLNLAHEAALDLSIPQLVIDNYYNESQPQRFTHEWPAVNQWLLVGLSRQGQYGRIGKQTVLIPPLLTKSISPSTRRVDLTILGYDSKVTELGIALLTALPAGTTAHLIHRDLSTEQIDALRLRIGVRRLSTQTMPEDLQLRDCLRGSRVVVCKNGFQQMVESLAVGTPVATYEAGGGVPQHLLNKQFQPFVTYSTPQCASDPCLISRVKQWIDDTPTMPWTGSYEDIDDPLRLSAQLFLEAIQTCIDKQTQSTTKRMA